MKTTFLSRPFDENREFPQSRRIFLTFWGVCTTIIKISAQRQEPGGRSPLRLGRAALSGTAPLVRSARPPPYAVFRPGTQNSTFKKHSIEGGSY